MLAGLVTTSYNFVDMIFASRLGSVEVASIAFVAPFFMMLQALAIGVIRGGISIIATLLGQQEPDEASAYATQLRFSGHLAFTHICSARLFYSARYS